MRIIARLIFATSLIWISGCWAANAWSLKTHIWITQQVLNDALDGELTIEGRNYTVPPHVLDALRRHPDRYRMGSLGPDVFPDPVVGQMTTHPGVDGGWQTDDWLKHVLNSARTPEEVAFAYGFVAHAASDIFAHSYVNMYAGDIFLLTDGESEVELRHFALEKYIESLTPHPADANGIALDWGRDLGTPSAFLRDTLISGGDVSRQNFRSKAGYHLTAMHEVRHAVTELRKGTQDVISTLTKWGAKYFEQQIKLEADLAAGKLAIEAAKVALATEEAVLRVKREAYEAALRALKEANDIILKHPELITHNEQLLAAQIKIAADAAAEATRIAADVISAIGAAQNFISDLVGKLGDFCDIPVIGDLPGCSQIKEKIKEFQDKINIWNLQKQVAERIRDETAGARDRLKELVDRLKREHEKAIKGIAEKTYEAAILVAETELKLQEKVLETKKRALVEAEAVSEKISKEIQKLTPIVGDIKKAIDRYNPVTLLIQKWLDDIDVGMEEYIKAGHRAGLLMLTNSGNPLKEYQDWYACYGQVFQAIPKEIGQTGCLVQRFIEDVKNEYDKLIDDLPEIVRWIISPTREVERRVKEKVKPELDKATFRIVGFITDPRTAEFLELLSHPKYATRAKLVEVYSKEKSKKGLLTFADVATDFVNKDLNVQAGFLTPDSFLPLTHAVTLTKLTLLGPDQLNRLVRDLTGVASLPDLYPAQGGGFTILLNAVRSIDGNHQWQAYGLPYPKPIGRRNIGPENFPYGRDGFKDKTKGFRFWTDTYLRERVFLKLFPGGVLGRLGDRPELSGKHYAFPACPQNPYPRTQDPQTGEVRPTDPTCTRVSHPERPIDDFPTATEAEFRDRYFQCSQPVVGLPYWTVAGSYRHQATARRDAEAIRRSFPDMTVELWRPQHSGKYWTIMAAACTSQDRAEEARDLTIRRGIARDAFIWHPHLPWRADRP